MRRRGRGLATRPPTSRLRKWKLTLPTHGWRRDYASSSKQECIGETYRSDWRQQQWHLLTSKLICTAVWRLSIKVKGMVVRIGNVKAVIHETFLSERRISRIVLERRHRDTRPVVQRVVHPRSVVELWRWTGWHGGRRAFIDSPIRRISVHSLDSNESRICAWKCPRLLSWSRL